MANVDSRQDLRIEIEREEETERKRDRERSIVKYRETASLISGHGPTREFFEAKAIIDSFFRIHPTLLCPQIIFRNILIYRFIPANIILVPITHQ